MKKSRYNYKVKFGRYTILYNMLSKAILLLDESDFDNKIMLENGFYISDDVSEYKIANESFVKATYDESYLSLTIIPDFACNMRCTYCYQDKVEGHIDFELLQAGLIQHISKAKKLKAVHIEWFGGEPTLYTNHISILMQKISEICEKKKLVLSVSINTNLFELSDDKIDALKRMNVDSIITTIAGWKDAHDLFRKDRNGQGTYDKILRNIMKLQNIFDVTICINITSESLKTIDKLIEDLNVLDKEKITLTFLRVVNNGKMLQEQCLSNDEYVDVVCELMEKLIIQGFNIAIESNFSGKSLFCGAQHCNSFTILPNAEITGCVDGCCKNDTIGQLTYEGLRVENLKNAFNPYEDDECLVCDILPYCNGGCSYLRKEKLSPCPDEKKAFDRYLYLYVLSYLKKENELMFHSLLSEKNKSLI